MPTTPIPQSLGLPKIGHMLGLTIDPMAVMQRLHRQFPQLVEVAVPPHTFFVVTNPTLIEEVLVTKQKHFHKDGFLKHHASALFGNGLLSSDGDFWLRQRRMAQPAFHRQRITEYTEIISAKTAVALAALPHNQPIDILATMMELTLTIVAETLFGVITPRQLITIGQALHQSMEYFTNDPLRDIAASITRLPLYTAKNAAYAAAIQALDTVIDEIIAERITQPRESTDLLGMFLSARDDDDQPMSHSQLRDECKTLFLAGHETTALTLTWSIWLLLRHPDCVRTLQAELTQVIGDRLPTMADMPNLVYTEQVIREAMRLYPPAYTIARSCIADVTIGDYAIPAGKDVTLSQYAMHRDPRWYDQPDAFIPSRWSEEFKAQLPKYAYFPFGGGPRLCIGQQFALVEATLILAMVMRHGDWQLLPWQRVVPAPAITLRPKRGVMVQIHRRA
jgi:cytochrome P450